MPKRYPSGGFDGGNTINMDERDYKAMNEDLKNESLWAISGELLSDTDYWKQRCLLAEQCLEESPCDPDITSDQIKAWTAYHKFISWAGNTR